MKGPFSAEDVSTFKVVRSQHPGLPATVAKMDELAHHGQTHPRVRQFAINTTRKIYAKDHLSELAAVYYAVCAQMKYVRDPSTMEMIHHPAQLADQMAGDCDDMALFLKATLASLEQSIGVPMRFVLASFQPGADFSHVFLIAQDTESGVWIVLDPVAGPNTRKMIKAIHRYEIVE